MVPHYDAGIAYKWVLIWTVVCGLPIAISLGLPPWVKSPAPPPRPVTAPPAAPPEAH